MCAADRCQTRVKMRWALGGAFEYHTTATTKLLIELLLEGLAQQVKGKGVEAGVGESQDTSHDTAHKVNQGSVHLVGGKEGWEKMVHKMERNRSMCILRI